MKFLLSIDSNIGEKVYFYIWSKADSVPCRVDGRAICISQQEDVILASNQIVKFGEERKKENNFTRNIREKIYERNNLSGKIRRTEW